MALQSWTPGPACFGEKNHVLYLGQCHMNILRKLCKYKAEYTYAVLLCSLSSMFNKLLLCYWWHGSLKFTAGLRWRCSNSAQTALIQYLHSDASPNHWQFSANSCGRRCHSPLFIYSFCVNHSAGKRDYVSRRRSAANEACQLSFEENLSLPC